MGVYEVALASQSEPLFSLLYLYINSHNLPFQELPYLSRTMSAQENAARAGREKDYADNGYHLDDSTDTDNALHKIRTAGSISISPELFEKLYLSPQNKVSGELRKTFGNPTPM